MSRVANGPMGLELMELEVFCDENAPGTVRQGLRQLVPLRDQRDDVLLVATELVTNAVLHSGCDGDDVLEIRAELAPRRLMISVRDPGSSGRDVQPRTGDPAGGGGWGLQLIERLAARWGAERDDGYQVWAEMRLAA